MKPTILKELKEIIDFEKNIANEDFLNDKEEFYKAKQMGFSDQKISLIRNQDENEISKISFNPQGNKIITASSDKTCRIWSTENGNELQVLDGHEDEIFSCAFNYEGDTIITGSQDNACRIWRDQVWKYEHINSTHFR